MAHPDQNQLYLKTLNNITTFIFDVDGVLTDSSLFLLENELIRTMNARDGYAMRKAVQEGYRVCIITGGRNEAVKVRLEALGVQDVYLGAYDKVAVYEEYITGYELRDSEILYMGDDLPDHDVMTKVALPTCPADAAPEIKAVSTYISTVKGGHGCVRDVIEQVLKAQDKWSTPLGMPPPPSVF